MNNLVSSKQQAASRNSNPASCLLPPARYSLGYTLIELIVAVGLFAVIMTLASGSYLVMIGINRQTQSVATGINNLSFALETMARTIRTGTNYSCGGGCPSGSSSFSVDSADGTTVTYAFSSTPSGGVIMQNGNELTDPSVNISSLMFYPSGINPADGLQPRVTIVIKGTVSAGPGKVEEFAIQTGATMRGFDL